MTERNYNQISHNIWSHYHEKLNEWEEKFIWDMLSQVYDYTEKQKETILNINRKYLAQR